MLPLILDNIWHKIQSQIQQRIERISCYKTMTYLFRRGVGQILVVVKAFRVIEDTTLLTERHITTTAVILHFFRVFTADHWSLMIRDVFLLGFTQSHHSMSFEAVHELVGHNTVGTQEVGAIETTGDGRQLFAFTAGARNTRIR